MDAFVLQSTDQETFCSEDIFLKVLVLERKKTERFGRPFLLVLLDVENLLKNGKRPEQEILEDLFETLNHSTREIDLKGWYRQGTMIGVLCTEVSSQTKALVVNKIKNRLSTDISREEVALLNLYLIDYPQYETHVRPESEKAIIKELRPERKGVFYS